MLLTFGDLERVDLAVLVDALIHESIHSFLFTCEEVETKFIVHPVQAEQQKILSPWSESELRLPAYVHACIVWYGLYWLWIRAVDSISPKRRREMQDRAFAGFTKRPVSNGLVSSTHLLSPAVTKLLLEIEARMSHLT
jgi:hypothetical protein